MWVFWLEVKLFKYLINFKSEQKKGFKLYLWCLYCFDNWFSFSFGHFCIKYRCIYRKFRHGHGGPVPHSFCHKKLYCTYVNRKVDAAAFNFFYLLYFCLLVLEGVNRKSLKVDQSKKKIKKTQEHSTWEWPMCLPSNRSCCLISRTSIVAKKKIIIIIIIYV